MDAGRVVDPYKLNLENVPNTITLSNGMDYNPQNWFNHEDEAFHIAYGVGLHFALNQNFIVAIDYGMAAKKEDGTTGLYINLNWLFQLKGCYTELHGYFRVPQSLSQHNLTP